MPGIFCQLDQIIDIGRIIQSSQLGESGTDLFPSDILILHPVFQDPHPALGGIHDTGTSLPVIMNHPVIIDDLLGIHDALIGEIFIVNNIADFKEDTVKNASAVELVPQQGQCPVPGHPGHACFSIFRRQIGHALRLCPIPEQPLECTLDNIRNMFIGQNPAEAFAPAVQPVENEYAKKLKIILNKVGISGEKGSADIVKICEHLKNSGMDVSAISVGQMCESISDNPKSVEQRIRRAIAAGMSNIAHMGIEDFMNETFMSYSATLFSFEDVRTEMDFIRGRTKYNGKVSIKKFIDGLMLEADRF